MVNNKDNVGIVDPSSVAHLSGMDFLTQIKNGVLPRPPISAHLSFEVSELEPGKAVFKAQPKLEYYNAIACVHGGYIATLLDTAMACAIQTRLPAGKAYTTLEFKVNFIRAVYEKTGDIFAVGTLIHIGRTTATAEGKLVDANGKLYAFGTTTCSLFPIPNTSSKEQE